MLSILGLVSAHVAGTLSFGNKIVAPRPTASGTLALKRKSFTLKAEDVPRPARRVQLPYDTPSMPVLLCGLQRSAVVSSSLSVNGLHGANLHCRVS